MSIRQTVRKGALLLDDYRSEWYQIVEPERLDMHSYSFCVLGQIWGSYDYGMAFFRRKIEPLVETWTYDHGFFVDGPDEIYDFLDYYWTEEIMQRRMS